VTLSFFTETTIKKNVR